MPTRAEALAILNSAPRRYRAAVALGLSGLRVGEVLGLDAGRLALEHREITVDQQMQRVGNHLVLTTPKSEKVRTITLPPFVVFELRRHLRDHQADGLLLRSTRSPGPGPECADVEGDVCGIAMRRDRFYAAAWHPALTGAGLGADRFVFHGLRHFCASNLLAEGASLTAVAGYLGDTVETVTRTYLHWLRDDRDVPAAVLERVLSPVAGPTAEAAL